MGRAEIALCLFGAGQRAIGRSVVYDQDFDSTRDRANLRFFHAADTAVEVALVIVERDDDRNRRRGALFKERIVAYSPDFPARLPQLLLLGITFCVTAPAVLDRGNGAGGSFSRLGF